MTDKKQMRVIPRGKAMQDKLGLGKWAVDHLVKRDPSFPRPIPIGNRVGYIEQDIDAWLVKQRQESIERTLGKAAAGRGRPPRKQATA